VRGREIPGLHRQPAALFREAVFDPQTVDLLTKQAGDFGGTVAELAEQRDDAEIRLMRTLDEIPLPQ
jgi:hypothetical protein